MNVVIAQPPNVAEIDRVFPGRGKNVIFAWGDTIYNPGGVHVPRHLQAHEGAHSDRQRTRGVEAWWRSYLDDPEFRYREEVVGHAAEYLSQAIGQYDRNRHARLLMTTTGRLLAPFYEYGIRRSHKQATHDLLQAAHRLSK